jgi:hypothetical protein
MDSNITAAFLSGYLGGVVFGAMVAVSLYRKIEAWEKGAAAPSIDAGFTASAPEPAPARPVLLTPPALADLPQQG